MMPQTFPWQSQIIICFREMYMVFRHYLESRRLRKMC